MPFCGAAEDHSPLMPASAISFPHFALSLWMNFAKASGDEGAGSAPRARIFSTAAGSLNALTKALGDEGKVPPGSDHIPAGVPVVSESLWRQYHYEMRGNDSPETKQKAHVRAREGLQGRLLIGVWNGQVWKI